MFFNNPRFSQKNLRVKINIFYLKYLYILICESQKKHNTTKGTKSQLPVNKN